MCTFENKHRVLVCDVAIRQVREAVSTAFGDMVQFTPAPGQGTRVEVPLTVDEGAFQQVTREAIASAQAGKMQGRASSHRAIGERYDCV